MIRVHNLQKQFGESHVLRGISCEIATNEVVCVIGPSGSGKSTFLRCINALETLSGGEVLVNGFAIHSQKTDLNKMRESVGMVFQRFNLFPHMTVLENIIMAPMGVKKLSRADAVLRAEALLRKVGLLDKIDAYPSSLSGGQQQRVAIARALAMNPKVLLCDEITSALDPELVGEVLKVLEQLAKEGMTLILVTHEMNFAREVGDRVVFMHQGKVWEQGDSRTLFANPQTQELKQFIASVRGLSEH